MDRPADLAPSDPDKNGPGLGPVGDWLGGDWPATAADRIESVISSVRRKTTGPAIVASRAVVYGLVAVVLVIMAGILGLIAVLRALDAVLPMWAVHLLVGAILSLAGMYCWGRRTKKEIMS